MSPIVAGGRRGPIVVPVLFALLVAGAAAPAAAREDLCDSSTTDCRTPLMDLIRAETVAIDVGLWFMEDARYSPVIIERWNAGVRVRVLMDPRVNTQHPVNAIVMQQLASAGIPMRKRTAEGVEHWKMMLFAGQQTMYFGSANFSDEAFVPIVPFVNYTDETNYITDDPSLIHSFMTKFDDAWTDTANYATFANPVPLRRAYPTYAVNTDLNFVPGEDFVARTVARLNAEQARIDVMMYRIVSNRAFDAMVAAYQRGVPIRMIVDPLEYRDPNRLDVAYFLDRLYLAGIPLRFTAHQGLNHGKLTLLYGQGMSIFGSSNWTTPSAKTQHEHNYFTTKPALFNWFVNYFDRRWNNAAGYVETTPFVPLPPDPPAIVAPANGAGAQASSGLRLAWNGGPWGQVYDVYFGTSPNPPLLAADQALGPSRSAGDSQSFTLPPLSPGAQYYWRIVSKTVTGLSNTSAVATFSTAALPVPRHGVGDFDGDAKADPSVFRPSTGEWFVLNSKPGGGVTIIEWGAPGDIPVPGDYDGDGRNDLAVYRPSSGVWYILASSTNYASGFSWPWGGPNDTPVPGDFDGDGKTDSAVFRRTTGQWIIRRSSDFSTAVISWGGAKDIPVPADYDGDHKTDVAVFRPSSGEWFRVLSSTGKKDHPQFGGPGDIPVPADYDGFGAAEIAVFRPSTGQWFFRRLSGVVTVEGWGSPGDIPTPNDYDGVGIVYPAVFRPSTGQWFVRRPSDAALYTWGIGSDIPLLGRR